METNGNEYPDVTADVTANLPGWLILAIFSLIASAGMFFYAFFAMHITPGAYAETAPSSVSLSDMMNANPDINASDAQSALDFGNHDAANAAASGNVINEGLVFNKFVTIMLAAFCGISGMMSLATHSMGQHMRRFQKGQNQK